MGVWRKNDIKLLLEMNEKHISVEEQAKALYKSVTAVNQWRHSHGIKFPDLLTAAELKEAKKLRWQGYTLTDIAKKYNVSLTYMFNHLRNIVPIEHCGPVWNADSIPQLEKAILNSKNWEQVAEKINKPVGSVMSFACFRFGSSKLSKIKKEIEDKNIQ